MRAFLYIHVYTHERVEERKERAAQRSRERSLIIASGRENACGNASRLSLFLCCPRSQLQLTEIPSSRAARSRYIHPHEESLLQDYILYTCVGGLVFRVYTDRAGNRRTALWAATYTCDPTTGISIFIPYTVAICEKC